MVILNGISVIIMCMYRSALIGKKTMTQYQDMMIFTKSRKGS